MTAIGYTGGDRALDAEGRILDDDALGRVGAVLAAANWLIPGSRWVGSWAVESPRRLGRAAPGCDPDHQAVSG